MAEGEIRVQGPRCQLMAAAALLLAATGCEWLGLSESEGGLAPLEQIPIVFAAPEMVTIKPGDTLAVLAKRHKVTVADLKSWNGLPSDTIEVDQVLLVWPAQKPVPRTVAVAPGQPQRPSLQSVMGTDLAPAQDNPPPGLPVQVVSGTPGVAAGAAGTAPVVEPGPKISIQRPALVALLGMQVGSDTDLAEAAAGLQHHDANLGNQVSLEDRSLTTGSTVDTLHVERAQMRNLGPQIPDVPVSAPRLSKPAAKTCLRGGSTVIGEDGVTRSSGLSVAQINAAMGQISRYTVKCFPPGTGGSYEVIVEITVGCNGQVSNVFLVSGGVVPGRVTSCIQQTLGYASFPAHAQPDGASFQYPMKFRF